MKDLHTEQFSLDPLFDFTILDEFSNSWDGDFEPMQCDIALGSGGDCATLLEVSISEFDNIESWKVTQVSSNRQKEDAISFVKENFEYFKDVLQLKLEDPDINGEC
ncbi:hypothetical protein HZP35_17485 [Elizabethkingia anophelis]|nr:hypothetical protein [Elizabethkingia anophelis]MCT4156732.1 hypothetical protein [Elizabethkingia anophelis]MCT4171053.1 hypothetical protein [Elizabethkingia anophelis]MCT4245468.1 hypothetical protein [Elizabethkingia anophelis]MCT4249201.1 hypothetical protein [Elizabethkingia anophelis]